MSLEGIELEENTNSETVNTSELETKTAALADVEAQIGNIAKSHTPEVAAQLKASPSLTQDVLIFIQNAANSNLSEGSKDLNANYFDIDGEKGLDKIEFDTFTKALEQAIQQIIMLDSVGAFKQAQNNADEHIDDATEFSWGDVATPMIGAAKGIYHAGDYAASKLEGVGSFGYGEAELEAMKSRPASASLKSVQEIAILTATNIGSGVEEAIKVISSTPLATASIPEYMNLRADNQSGDPSRMANAQIHMQELKNVFPIFEAIDMAADLTWEKVQEICSQLWEMLTSDTQETAAFIATLLVEASMGYGVKKLFDVLGLQKKSPKTSSKESPQASEDPSKNPENTNLNKPGGKQDRMTVPQENQTLSTGTDGAVNSNRFTPDLMKHNAGLGPIERQQAFETSLGISLTPNQKQTLLQIHDYASGKEGLYTPRELATKRLRAIKEAGLTKDQVTKLMDEGLLGDNNRMWNNNTPQWVSPNSNNIFEGSSVEFERSDGTLSNGTIINHRDIGWAFHFTENGKEAFKPYNHEKVKKVYAETVTQEPNVWTAAMDPFVERSGNGTNSDPNLSRATMQSNDSWEVPNARNIKNGTKIAFSRPDGYQYQGQIDSQNQDGSLNVSFVDGNGQPFKERVNRQNVNWVYKDPTPETNHPSNISNHLVSVRKTPNKDDTFNINSNEYNWTSEIEYGAEQGVQSLVNSIRDNKIRTIIDNEVWEPDDLIKQITDAVHSGNTSDVTGNLGLKKALEEAIDNEKRITEKIAARQKKDTFTAKHAELTTELKNSNPRLKELEADYERQKNTWRETAGTRRNLLDYEAQTRIRRELDSAKSVDPDTTRAIDQYLEMGNRYNFENITLARTKQRASFVERELIAKESKLKDAQAPVQTAQSRAAQFRKGTLDNLTMDMKDLIGRKLDVLQDRSTNVSHLDLSLDKIREIVTRRTQRQDKEANDSTLNLGDTTNVNNVTRQLQNLLSQHDEIVNNPTTFDAKNMEQFQREAAQQAKDNPLKVKQLTEEIETAKNDLSALNQIIESGVTNDQFNAVLNRHENTHVMRQVTPPPEPMPSAELVQARATEELRRAPIEAAIRELEEDNT